MEPSRAKTIWVDVEDLLQYSAANPRPSGSQRLAFEIMRALVQGAGTGRVRFVRRAAEAEPPLHAVSWMEVEATFRHRLADSPSAGLALNKVRRRGVRRIVHSLPPPLRDPILRARTLQLSWRARRAAASFTPTIEAGAALAPGDHFLVLGAPWAVPGFAETLGVLKHRYRLVTALLVHDLVPVRRPEWCGRDACNALASFLDDCLSLFDCVLATSRHTAADVTAYARQRRIRLTGPVETIPVGKSFLPADGESADPAGLPHPGYVLVVGAIEPRNNHELAVRIWRLLIDETQARQRDPDSVPELVFAGRVGRLVGDLLQQLDAAAWLDGRVRLIRSPSDAELRRLYEGCRFTLVPSWFEGCGLPVSESLAMGKPCLASSATAIPEAGGDLCRYFDPGDLPAAHRAVSALLDDPRDVAAWQDRVRREFRPTSWAETAQATLAHLGA